MTSRRAHLRLVSSRPTRSRRSSASKAKDGHEPVRRRDHLRLVWSSPEPAAPIEPAVPLQPELLPPA